MSQVRKFWEQEKLESDYKPFSGTFKLKKRDLQQEGFNPDMMAQEVYIVNNEMKTYVLITQEIYNNIVNGNMRF